MPTGPRRCAVTGPAAAQDRSTNAPPQQLGRCPPGHLRCCIPLTPRHTAHSALRGRRAPALTHHGAASPRRSPAAEVSQARQPAPSDVELPDALFSRELNIALPGFARAGAPWDAGTCSTCRLYCASRGVLGVVVTGRVSARCHLRKAVTVVTVLTVITLGGNGHGTRAIPGNTVLCDFVPHNPMVAVERRGALPALCD